MQTSLDEINYLLENYIYKKLNDELNEENTKELIEQIKEKISLLDLEECNELYNKYLKYLYSINNNINNYEQQIMRYYQKQSSYTILIGAYLYSLHKELDKLNDIKLIYKGILKYIRTIRRKKRLNSVLKLVKKM